MREREMERERRFIYLGMVIGTDIPQHLSRNIKLTREG
jgi:hypothetical protein